MKSKSSDTQDPPVLVTSLQSLLTAVHWNRGHPHRGLMLHLLVQSSILGPESREHAGGPCEVEQACLGGCVG